MAQSKLAKLTTESIFYDNGVTQQAISTETIKQDYEIINKAAKQAIGLEAIEVIDTASFVDLGRTINQSAIYVDAFLNSLTEMFARTIIAERLYKSQLDMTELSAEEYGAIVRKIRFRMPEAKEDPSVALENGKSVDPYVVNLPEVLQKNFGKIDTHRYYVTMQRKWIKLAFESESMMDRFISAIFAYVKNRMELDRENTMRMTIANYVGAIGGTAREIKLISKYEEDTGVKLTAAEAQFNADFLRYAIAEMQNYSSYMQDMRTDFNSGVLPTFTPLSDQRFMIETSFNNRMRTEMLYGAYHDDYLKKGDYRLLNFWQNPKTPRSVKVTMQGEDGNTTNVEVNNLVAIIYDRDALGTFRNQTETYTTPVNAAGRYVNTNWFVDYQPINDLDENCIIFTLN